MQFFTDTAERDPEPGTCTHCGYATEDRQATLCDTHA